MPLRLLPNSLRENFSAGRLGRHLSLNFIQVVAESGSMMVLTFVVARLWGSELFGLLGVLLVGLHLLTMITEGLTTSQLKYIAGQEALVPGSGASIALGSLRTILALALAMSVVLGLAMKVYMHDIGLVGWLDFVLLMAVCWTRIGKSALETALRAQRKFTPPAMAGVFLGPAHMVVTWIAVAAFGAGVTTYLLLLAVFQGAGMVWLYRPVSRATDGSRITPAPGPWRPMFVYAVPLMFRGLVGFFYLKINIPMIEHYVGLRDVGYFRLAEQVLLIPILITGSMVSAMAPRVASLVALGERARLADLTSRSYQALLIAMLPLTIAFAANGIILTPLFPGYDAAIVMIQLFSLTLVVRAFSMLCSGALLVHGNHGFAATVLAVSGSVLNLLVVWWLLHKGGTAIDAALGTTLVHLVISIIAVATTHIVMKIPFRILPARSAP